MITKQCCLNDLTLNLKEVTGESNDSRVNCVFCWNAWSPTAPSLESCVSEGYCRVLKYLGKSWHGGLRALTTPPPSDKNPSNVNRSSAVPTSLFHDLMALDIYQDEKTLLHFKSDYFKMLLLFWEKAKHVHRQNGELWNEIVIWLVNSWIVFPLGRKHLQID